MPFNCLIWWLRPDTNQRASELARGINKCRPKKVKTNILFKIESHKSVCVLFAPIVDDHTEAISHFRFSEILSILLFFLHHCWLSWLRLNHHVLSHDLIFPLAFQWLATHGLLFVIACPVVVILLAEH